MLPQKQAEWKHKKLGYEGADFITMKYIPSSGRWVEKSFMRC